MKRNDINALHEKTTDALQAQLVELQQELAKSRVDRAAGKLSNTSLVSTLQDDIARVKTIIREKELAASLAASAKTSTEEKATEETTK